ncbi:MAG: sulfate permease [Bacteroidales bacterium]|nr:sulfate permease [Candidatus Cryptobacteroides choladohippi]
MVNLKNVYRPRIRHIFWKGGYDKSTFVSDLIAGIIVGIIALPLAIAFGIASGVSPQQGLITAIIAGFLISLLGGTRFLIGGPTGAFIVIVAGIIAKYGISGLTIATILAGVFLIIMGVCKLGVIFKFIPYPIVVGFTSGIALTIFSTQMKDFFGFTMDVPAGFIQKWICYFSNLGNINWIEAAVSFGCLIIAILWNRRFKKIPGSLIVLIVGTGISLILKNCFGIQLATIGTKFPELAGGMAFPKPSMPEISLSSLKELVSPAFTIAILCAIESLLAAMVTDGVTGRKHNANTELIGEGIANIITPLFGGIPATGAIARTMANINNGGKSPVAGLIHAVVLLLIYLFLMPYAVYIPLSCLAAILVLVAYGMSEWRTFKYLLQGDRADVSVLLITFALTVIVDLTVAIEVGVLLAIVLFVRRVMQTSDIHVIESNRVSSVEDDEELTPEDTPMLDIPSGVDVYEINGPFFFGLASKFEEFDNRGRNDTKVRILRMRNVPFMDSTGIKNLRNLCDRASRRGIQTILSGVNDNVRSELTKFGLDRELGEENIQPNIIPALARAREILALKQG